jgi:DNA mismatch repair protein MutS
MIENLIQEIRQKLTQSILAEDSTVSCKEEFIKIHETEKNGISFQTTKKRSKILKDKIEKRGEDTIVEINTDFLGNSDPVVVKWKDLRILNASTNYDEITFPFLSRQSRDLHMIEDELNTTIVKVYQEILGKIADSWYGLIENISVYISKLDVAFCKAYLAKEYNYCQPVIHQKEKAFVNALGLRHCLIEHLQKNEIYVTNDISLGCNNQDGILLYGTNAVGKTSMIRALGIAIIMAQSGCYVPCSRFEFSPYTAIYSRILGNDNIFKGLSTFAVEMSELRMILKMSDQNSLILGDELCSGTETDSALSIFMAGLMKIVEIGSSFIFATHFHEILKFDEMKELSSIAVKHMSVVYDYDNECLIYDRKMKDGPGNRMYGLEVCKSLFLPSDFLEKAYEIRNRYCTTIHGELNSKESRYNTKKIRGICEICGENMGEEIHHLQWQKDANMDGFIEHFHKNHVANLASLCESCHDKIHHDDPSELTISPTSINSKKSLQRHVRKKTTKGYKIASIAV